MTDLSVLIPARNEMFLARTIADLLENMRADTEIIAILDGAWADPPVADNDRVTLVYYPQSIGQRAATNAAARMAQGKYVMKCDAHCSFAPGFDEVMLADMQDDWTMVPVMRNLHAFDWVCEEGHRRYQGPSGPCRECGKPTTMDVVWIAKPSPQSTAYRFDNTLHFQYWGEYKRKQEGDIVDTLSLQGSCFLMTKQRYFDLGVCDETWGSWGQQGVEVAVKSWLSGGRVVVNKKTWYAHMFRTQGGDFGFPYPQSGKQVEHARRTSREILIGDKWDKAVHPFSWLIAKFQPPGWEVSKGVLYYTDNRLDPTIMQRCQEQLSTSVDGHRIVSVSLKEIDFGDNIVLPLERGYLTMFKQILTGLEELKSDVVYFCEHDVLYPPEHFEFIPPERDKYYYNTNVWKVDSQGNHYLHYDCRQTSGLVAYRDLLLQHYRERVRRVEAEGYSRKMGFEPGTHHRTERVDDYKAESFQTARPIVDIRHDSNLTPSRWRQDQFRDRRNCRGWTEADEVPGWGKVEEFL